MKRTYFVPLLVLAGFFLASAAVAFPGAVFMQRMGENQISLFEYRYEKAGNYADLYDSALQLRRDLSRKETEGLFYCAACSMMVGILLLWWALDRRRLILRLHEARTQEDKSTP